MNVTIVTTVDPAAVRCSCGWSTDRAGGYYAMLERKLAHIREHKDKGDTYDER